jgi:hypothetical protein
VRESNNTGLLEQAEVSRAIMPMSNPLSFFIVPLKTGKSSRKPYHNWCNRLHHIIAQRQNNASSPTKGTSPVGVFSLSLKNYWL